VCPSIRTVGGGATQLCHVGSKEQDTSSVVICIKLNTTTSLGGATRQMTKSILPNLKQRKANYAYMHSNAQTIVVITKWTLTSVYSENIDSIANGTAKNKPKSVKADIS